jgi:hypothetical protein
MEEFVGDLQQAYHALQAHGYKGFCAPNLILPHHGRVSERLFLASLAVLPCHEHITLVTVGCHSETRYVLHLPQQDSFSVKGEGARVPVVLGVVCHLDVVSGVTKGKRYLNIIGVV